MPDAPLSRYDLKPPARTLLASLRSTLCPCCGGGKSERRTLCGTCYYVLPKRERTALYNLLGDGYAEAVEAALKLLGVSDPHWPEVKA